MTASIIWAGAALIYALFWSWYVGFGRKISMTETEDVIRVLDGGHATPQQIHNIRKFLEHDDGRDFVMVNALHLKEPKPASRALLKKYSNAFLGDLLKRAGHPVLFAQAAAGNIENLACGAADDWTAAALVRYRSRADFAAMVKAFAGSEHHGFKLAALEKTFAFPASPWFMLGGPRVMVALLLALAAALLHIALM